MDIEIHQLNMPESPNHGKFYIQRFRAFLPTIYLYADGTWSPATSRSEVASCWESKEHAFNFLAENT